MKITNTFSVSILATLLFHQGVEAATCGGGIRGDGVCPQAGFCCSDWGYCGPGVAYCGTGPQVPQPTPVPAQPTTPAPVPPSAAVSTTDDSRMIAYVGNWQACPTEAQLAQYTHIVIAFAVSYTWAPGKNNCSPTCEIATPPICNNAANPWLLNSLKAQGKKIIVSFGGAGMGGSWAGDQNDCWEYCYGRETQVVDRLVEIVDELDADGIDVDYEYFYEDNQSGSGFTKGAQAQNFLMQVTVGLRNKLAPEAIVTHAPMDVDLEPHTAYFRLLKDISHTLDFIMPQYYNGVTRPVLDGIDGTGVGTTSALDHYNEIADQFFGGDATRMVFGFCISDCSGTGSNANANDAAIVMSDLALSHSCHGGAFFWVAEHDREGSWSSAVNQVIASSTSCPVTTISPAPVTARPSVDITTISPAPVPVTTISPAPVTAPPTDITTISPGPVTAPPTTASPTTMAPTVISTITPAPVTAPPTTAGPTTEAPGPSQAPCCPPGFSGLLAYKECTEFYNCNNGQVIGFPTQCPVGLLFDNNLQVCNWLDQVSCLGDAICN